MDFPPQFAGGRRGALSLTYDDALAEHLDHVIPDLEAAGLRGSFYIPTGHGMAGSTWHTRTAEWKAATQRGHEIGNHSQHHPCSLSHKWIKPNRSLEVYDLGRMEMELVAASRDIRAEVGEAPHSFAYPCGEDWVGLEKVSYRPIVRRLFPAARGASSTKVLADPMDLAIEYVPAWPVPNGVCTEQVLAFIDSAVEQGRWAVLVFHGVGGGHALDIPRSAHRSVCAHVASRSDDLYCGTFIDVARQLSNPKR